ncbi:MAG: phosphoribosylanthranilate isomerase [Planctomycetaceae bacterium]|nr:phosphoribosylanthranilate isomerase [Planctomycetaceae bacterium]
MLKIKICGITRPEDAVAAAEEGADYVGLIFAKSARKIDIKIAQDILVALPKGVEAVGVFMNQTLDDVRRILDITGLKTAQLHGDESPRYAKELGAPVIKTFDTFNEGSLEKLKKFDAFAFLLDLPKGGGAGARSQIDPHWAVLAKRHGKVLLAGKLTADSVGPMIRKVRPWGVDVCSATERQPGIKDRAKLRDFIQAARQAHKETSAIKVKTR